MSDDCLHAAKLHLSEAADLAGTLASGFAMKKLTKALNRCNPIGVNPHSPQGYAENAFQGGNVGAPSQNPQYAAGSYPEGPVSGNFVAPPLPKVEYPGNTIPPAIVPDVMTDPCQGMKDRLASCRPSVPYCPSFMGQPTGEISPLTGLPQPVDVYSTLNLMAERYSYPKNPDGRAQGPMTAISQDDFLGGDFGSGIKRMREQLQNCRG